MACAYVVLLAIGLLAWVVPGLRPRASDVSGMTGPPVACVGVSVALLACWICLLCRRRWAWYVTFAFSAVGMLVYGIPSPLAYLYYPGLFVLLGGLAWRVLDAQMGFALARLLPLVLCVIPVMVLLSDRPQSWQAQGRQDG